MANHVTTNISFENLSEEAEKFLEKFSVEDASLLKELYSDYDETYDWYVDNIGAKWLTFEWIDNSSLSCISAWSAPIAFYNKLYKKLVELNSPEAKLWATYEDEMPNFVGTYGLAPKDYEYEEEMHEEFYEKYIGCKHWDEEKDEFNDDFWEKLSEWYDKEYNYFNEGYQEYLEETS